MKSNLQTANYNWFLVALFHVHLDIVSSPSPWKSESEKQKKNRFPSTLNRCLYIKAIVKLFFPAPSSSSNDCSIRTFMKPSLMCFWFVTFFSREGISIDIQFDVILALNEFMTPSANDLNGIFVECVFSSILISWFFSLKIFFHSIFIERFRGWNKLPRAKQRLRKVAKQRKLASGHA